VQWQAGATSPCGTVERSRPGPLTFGVPGRCCVRGRRGTCAHVCPALHPDRSVPVRSQRCRRGGLVSDSLEDRGQPLPAADAHGL
jgi:hypothetical protein